MGEGAPYSVIYDQDDGAYCLVFGRRHPFLIAFLVR